MFRAGDDLVLQRLAQVAEVIAVPGNTHDQIAILVRVLLGLPKQELWIYANRPRLNAPIVVAAGAAAKFVSGNVTAAPAWISRHGLEWLWRLAREPRRCWHRAMVYGPQFALYTLLELKGLRRFD